jgi:hypothetical protein
LWRLPTILLLFLPTTLLAQPATPQEAVALAQQDAARLGLCPTIRYLWVPPWVDRKLHYLVASAHINSLSRETLIVPPVVVLTDGTTRVFPGIADVDFAKIALIRIDLLHYRFDPKVWDQLGFQDVHFHVVLQDVQPIEETLYQGARWYRVRGGEWSKTKPEPKTQDVLALAPWLVETPAGLAALTDLVRRTQAGTPIVSVDGFLWQTLLQFNRKVGYDGLLEIKTQRDYEKLVGFDPRANVDPSYLDSVRAAIMISGVARAERRVSFYSRVGEGTYSVTSDNDVAIKKQNPLRFLDGDFQDKARETYGHLPNKMLIMGLFVGSLPGVGQKEGDKVDSAPDFVGMDRKSATNDGRIHKPLSCIRCHVDGGFQNVTCYFRTLAAAGHPLQTPDPKQARTLRSYQLPIDPVIENARRVYAGALLLCNGMTPQQYARAVDQVYSAADDPLPWARVAAELGTTLPQLTLELDRFNKFNPAFKDTIFSMVLVQQVKQIPLSRDQFLDSANLLQLQRRGIAVWPSEVKAIVIKLADIKRN